MVREGVFIGDSTSAIMDNEGADIIGDGPDNKEDSHLIGDCLPSKTFSSGQKILFLFSFTN